MADTEWLKRHKQQLLKQAKRELKMKKETYTLQETAQLLKVSPPTLYRYLAKQDLEIKRRYQGPHRERFLFQEDIIKIWMKRHTIYGIAS